jgi:hypothetical protein
MIPAAQGRRSQSKCELAQPALADKCGVHAARSSRERPNPVILSTAERRAREAILLNNIKRDLPVLTRLSEEAESHWGSEDLVYRFYHQSFKVFAIQSLTTTIVDALQALLPDAALDQRFTTIISEGTGKQFSYDMNARWDEATRPLLEAFFHANYFLKMAIKYGHELSDPPEMLPSGWAAVLCLFNLR